MIHRHIPIALALALALACGSDSPPPDAAPPEVEPPVRGAAAADDLRVLVAQIGVARACNDLRGRMIGLEDDSGAYIGTLWAERCSASYDGVELSVSGAGRGWRWVEREGSKAGGKFELASTVRFELEASITGDVDLAYTPDARVVTAWLTTTARDARLGVIGGVDVDAKGTWSSVVGVAGTVVSESPDEAGTSKIAERGRALIVDRLGEGMTATAHLCSGDIDLSFGHGEAGKMDTPSSSAGQLDETAVLHPGGLVMLGPETLTGETTLTVEPVDGAVRASLVCIDEARRVAEAYLEGGETPEIEAVASASVDRRTELQISGARCSGALVFEPLADAERPVKVRYRLDSPAGGDEPLLDCGPLDASDQAAQAKSE